MIDHYLGNMMVAAHACRSQSNRANPSRKCTFRTQSVNDPITHRVYHKYERLNRVALWEVFSNPYGQDLPKPRQIGALRRWMALLAETLTKLTVTANVTCGRWTLSKRCNIRMPRGQTKLARHPRIWQRLRQHFVLVATTDRMAGCTQTNRPARHCASGEHVSGLSIVVRFGG